MSLDNKKKIVIACQGGGSHTAFTAGVLKTILKDLDTDRYNIVGLSGTSGGAICALLTWYGLIIDDRDKAVEILDEFWRDNMALEPYEQAINNLVLMRKDVSRSGFTVPVEVSPYSFPLSGWAQDRLKNLIEKHIDFDRIRDIDLSSKPNLLVSAVEVNKGEFEIFKNKEVTSEAILASAAEPSLFKAVEIDGKTFWDGLFSKNPPVEDFTVDNDLVDPDEIWIVQINPQERENTPKSLHAIIDRRNELSGNMSMNNEIRFIKRINRFIKKGYLPNTYTYTEINKIQNKKDLHWTTKLDRSQKFIKSMIKHGKQQTEQFLENKQ